MRDNSTESTRWRDLRDEMPVAERWAYFDHAAVAPITRRAWERMRVWGDECVAHGDAHWSRDAQEIETVRLRAARLLGAAPEEIAFVANTSTGINLVAEGYPWQAGDNVVLPANEFPANQYPWLNLASRGVEARRVDMPNGRLDFQRLAEACDRRTRIIALSWVGYASGWRVDLDEATTFAQEHGAHLFVDAIQGLGVFPIDVRHTPIDFLAADGHKWLLGPEGAGLFYLKIEHLDLLRPVGIGWHSVVHSSDYARIDLAIRPTAARYEGGSWNMPGLLGLGASLELFLEYGAAPMGERLLEVSDMACDALKRLGATVVSPREAGHASGIVSFELPGVDPSKIRNHCLQRGVVLNSRAGRVRISPHAYSDESDIERLIDALDSARLA